MGFVKGLTLLVVLAACSSNAAPSTTAIAAGGAGSIVATNQGGSLEGHTPRGFAGMGNGLFAGDNLNPSFPEGEGVQLFLTFAVSSPPADLGSVILASEALTVRGTPFEDLGVLSAEIVSYDEFGPTVFDTPALSEAAACVRIGETGLECDVGALVRPLIDAGHTTVQFRLLFEGVADGDGQQDLAMFFRTDSNTNESGLFTLSLSG